MYCVCVGLYVLLSVCVGLHVFLSVCVCVGLYVLLLCVWSSEGSFQELLLSSYHVGMEREWMSGVRLHGKCLNPLSTVTGRCHL